MKEERAITLVTLAVTIIVLIILAGVSISTLIGDNGIITKAKQAKENIIYAGQEEQEQLNQLFWEMEQDGSYTEDDSGKDVEIANLEKEIALKEETIKQLQEQLDDLNNQLAQTNAKAEYILKDYKAYSGGKLLIGTMPNNGAVSTSLNAGQSYTIPKGYHNGSGKVTVNSLESQTQATATADDISNGKTAWVNGQLVIGTAETSPTEVVANITSTVSDGPNYWSTTYWIDVSNFNTLKLGNLTGGDSNNSAGVISVEADGRTILRETASGNRTINVSAYEEVAITIQGRYAKTMKLPITLY